MTVVTSWIGPTALAGSIGYVFHLNHLAAEDGRRPLLSTTSFALMLFVVYAVGAVPRTPFFPDWWYRSNLFNAVYRYAYCSEAVGYNLLKRVMHPAQPYPHSDYRGGIRALTEVRAIAGSSGSAALSPEALVRLCTNLPTWRPPCLDDLTRTDAVAASSPRQNPRSAAAAASAALEQLKRTRDESTVAAAGEPVPPLFALRGGLPVDVQKIKYQKGHQGVLVLPIPIFNDNYSYLIFSFRTKRCCLVDPADPIAALKCLLYLKKQLSGDERGEPEMKITDILTTHKHWDHAGGNKELVEYSRAEENLQKAETNENVCALDLNVYGPADESAHYVNRTVSDGDRFTVCGGAVHVTALATPGHTHGSLVFAIADAHAERTPDPLSDSVAVANKLAVFTGDALFSGGIGAPFETSSVEQLLKTRSSFVDSPVLQRHPITQEPVAAEDVLLYVGHEYTERLVSETYSIMTRVMFRGGAAPGLQDEPQMVPGVPEAGQTFRINLARALRDVKVLRAQTDGLDDAKKDGEDLVDADRTSLTPEELQRQRKLRHRIPLCTVPSTLALEKMINPLLTVKPETLTSVPLVGGVLDSKEVEKAIYLSTDRVVS